MGLGVEVPRVDQGFSSKYRMTVPYVGVHNLSLLLSWSWVWRHSSPTRIKSRSPLYDLGVL